MRLIASQVLLHARLDIMRQSEQQLPPHAADRRDGQHVGKYPAIGADEPRIGALGDDVGQCRNSDDRAGCEVWRGGAPGQTFTALNLFAGLQRHARMDRELSPV